MLNVGEVVSFEGVTGQFATFAMFSHEHDKPYCDVCAFHGVCSKILQEHGHLPAKLLSKCTGGYFTEVKNPKIPYLVTGDHVEPVYEKPIVDRRPQTSFVVIGAARIIFHRLQSGNVCVINGTEVQELSVMGAADYLLELREKRIQDKLRAKRKRVETRIEQNLGCFCCVDGYDVEFHDDGQWTATVALTGYIDEL